MQSSYAHVTRRSDGQSASDHRRSRILAVATPALFRPGWLGCLVHAVAEPGGIPPGRSRPEPQGPLR
jgi:hypothetical protein